MATESFKLDSCYQMRRSLLGERTGCLSRLRSVLSPGHRQEGSLGESKAHFLFRDSPSTILSYTLV